MRNALQDPLLVYAQWSHQVSQLLETSADATDFSHIAISVQNIEVKPSTVSKGRQTLDTLDSRGHVIAAALHAEARTF